MKMRHIILVGAATGLLLTSAAASARHDRDDDEERESSGQVRAVDEHRPLKADGRLVISNVAGIIEVEAWNKNEVHLTGHLGEDVEKLEITGDDKSLRIEVKVPRHSVGSQEMDSDLRLKVPAGVRLKASGVSSDVRVRGIKGEADLDSVSGDVVLEAASSRVRAHSVSGEVTVRAPNAAEADVETVSGDLSVTARGEIGAKSVSGDIHVEAVDVKELKAESVSGDVILDIKLVKDAEVRAETLSGDVRLRLPADLDGALEMETFSGELHASGERKFGDTKSYRKDGKGKGLVRLHSFSGDVFVETR
jgi:DUF4097 and DUF4098 domain-containing protein YvlB